MIHAHHKPHHKPNGAKELKLDIQRKHTANPEAHAPTLWASAGERAASGDGWKLPSSWRDPGLCGSQVRNRDRRWRSIDMRPPSTSPAAGRMDTPSRTNTVCVHTTRIYYSIKWKQLHFSNISVWEQVI